MQSTIGLPRLSLTELCFDVWEKGQLQRTHREQIKSVLLGDCLSGPDQRAINRLLYAVKQGWLAVAD